MPAKWTLSIISHGHRANINSLLRQLQSCVPPEEFAVVLTSNCGEDLQQVEASWPGPIRTRYNHKPLSFSENHNLALLGVGTKYVATIDPDLELTKSPFQALEQQLERMPNNSIVAPSVLDEYQNPADHARALPTPFRIIKRIFVRKLEPSTDWLAGLFLAMDHKTFKQLGGFSTRYRLYCEDVDICLRAQLSGGNLQVCNRVNVTHPARRQSRKNLRYFLWHLASLLILWRSSSYQQYQRALKVKTNPPA